MVKAKFEKIGIYADVGCTKPIETIEWNTGYILTLIDGTREILKNTAEGGQVVTATVYLKNESKWRFAITKISFPDKRIKIKVESPWLLLKPVKLTISFEVPKNPIPEDVIQADKILIEGYYVFGNR